MITGSNRVSVRLRCKQVRGRGEAKHFCFFGGGGGRGEGLVFEYVCVRRTILGVRRAPNLPTATAPGANPVYVCP